MAEPYLSRLRKLIEMSEISEQDGDIVCKHFFGGAAGWVDGKIFISLTPAGLALKLPDDDRRDLLAAGGKVLRYFPNAPVKSGYVIVPKDVRTDAAALRPWILKSLKAGRDGLPPH